MTWNEIIDIVGLALGVIALGIALFGRRESRLDRWGWLCAGVLLVSDWADDYVGFEPWGIALGLVQLLMFVGIVVLLVKSRAERSRPKSS